MAALLLGGCAQGRLATGTTVMVLGGAGVLVGGAKMSMESSHATAAPTSPGEHSGAAVLLSGLFAMGVGALILHSIPRGVPPCDCSSRLPFPSPPAPSDPAPAWNPTPSTSAAPPAASTSPRLPGTVPWFEVDDPGTSL
jgi:hypothetical protein